MSTIPYKRMRLNPFLQSKKNRILYKAITIYLIIGVGSLLITLFYLMGNLHRADSIIKFCIPGFALGISAGIIYLVGYRNIVSEQQSK
jgi:hypothetical protein